MTFKNFEGGKNGLRTFCFKFLFLLQRPENYVEKVTLPINIKMS